jgi:uncharacterized protein (TIGR00251 family)
MIQMTEKDGAVTFSVVVIPRAPRSAVAGEMGGALKLRIAAPPVDGKANEECRRFFADTLGIPRGSIEIVSGAKARNKIVRIKGMSATAVRTALGLGHEIL